MFHVAHVVAPSISNNFPLFVFDDAKLLSLTISQLLALMMPNFNYDIECIREFLRWIGQHDLRHLKERLIIIMTIEITL